MHRVFHIRMLALVALIAASHLSVARADIVVQGSFSSTGDVGFPNSPPGLSIQFGNGNGAGSAGNGAIFQLDGFINAAGQNWSNDGSGSGTSAQISFGLPSGIGFAFNSFASANNLLLDYTFVNNTGATLTDFQFLAYVDPDIGDDFTTEWAATAGTLAASAFDPATYQVGDPVSSSIFTNLMAGTLDNTNEFPASTALGDVSIGLGFRQASFAAGTIFEVRILLSDIGTRIGSFAITQRDPDFPNDTLTISGLAAVPEPSSFALIALGLAGVSLAARRVKRGG